jgi:hypothetical protein
MTDAPTLDTMATAALGTQFAELETRLVKEYGSEGEEVVRRVVSEERDRFAGARVHAFVPILVERSVRSRLDASDVA